MSDSSENNEEMGQISKYNDAGLSILRLNEYYTTAEAHANSGRLHAWKFMLDTIWRELFPDVIRLKKNKPKDYTELLIRNKKLLILISQATNKTKLYFALSTRHEFLREVQDRAGKAGVYVDEDDAGLE